MDYLGYIVDWVIRYRYEVETAILILLAVLLIFLLIRSAVSRSKNRKTLRGIDQKLKNIQSTVTAIREDQQRETPQSPINISTENGEINIRVTSDTGALNVQVEEPESEIKAVEPEPLTEAAIEPEAETPDEIEPEAPAEVETDAPVEVVPEAPLESEPEAIELTEPEIEIVDPGQNEEPEVVPEPEPEVIPEPEIPAEPEAEVEPEPIPEPEAPVEPEPEVDPEPEVEPEPIPEPEPTPEPEIPAEPEPEAPVKAPRVVRKAFEPVSAENLEEVQVELDDKNELNLRFEHGVEPVINIFSDSIPGLIPGEYVISLGGGETREIDLGPEDLLKVFKPKTETEPEKPVEPAQAEPEEPEEAAPVEPETPAEPAEPEKSEEPEPTDAWKVPGWRELGAALDMEFEPIHKIELAFDSPFGGTAAEEPVEERRTPAGRRSTEDVREAFEASQRNRRGYAEDAYRAVRSFATDKHGNTYTEKSLMDQIN